MQTRPFKPFALLLPMLFSAALVAGCGTMQGSSSAGGSSLMLQGDSEVPPVTTAATGSGSIVVAADKSVSGSISTKGIEATAAHIHQGAPGSNGPVVVPLTQSGSDTWSVPPGAVLTDAQYASYQEGKLYVNVHSKAHPAGEIRAQLKPKG